MPFPFIAAAIVGALALGGGGVVVTIAAVNESNNSDEAVIDRVIDGDTVDVRMYGDVHRVRLLNINAPEDNAVTGIAQCMGPEASAALERLLPEGSTVTLRYDSERYDRYDRLLAGIFVDNTLINAEMAREGLAGPMVVGGNTRFIDDVRSAESAAKDGRAGIFGDSLPCTLGSTVDNYRTQATTAIERTAPKDSAGIAEVVTKTTTVLGAADSADLAIDSIDWVTPGLRHSYTAAIRLMRGDVSQAKKALEASHKTAVAHEKQVARAAAKEAARIAAKEAARVAAEQAARVAAEQAAAAQAAADAVAEQAARDAQWQDSNNSSGGSSGATGGGSSSGDGGGSTYTGCRNYNGVGMIDTKGRSFQPIPCP